jgi:glycosyltransferase involved in cell wall biosynthesis
MLIKVLYVHHGVGMGGAPLSLLYLLQSLDRTRYEPVVACLHDGEGADLFRRNGFKVFIWSEISDFAHSPLWWYPLHDPRGIWAFINRLICLVPSALRAKKAIISINPNLIHLNASTLITVALGARWAGVPCIWHVREPVHNGYLGLRRFWLRRAVNTLPDAVIYICKANRINWQDRGSGEVIYNFVDFTQFNRNLSGKAVRNKLKLASTDKVILLLGGLNKAKGARKLVMALDQLRKRLPAARCVIAGYTGINDNKKNRIRKILQQFGLCGYAENVIKLIKNKDLSKNILLLGWCQNVPELISAVDIVAVPWVIPHFARPIIEAGAMARPVVAFQVDGVEEVVQHGITGLLVPPGNVEAFTDALFTILSDTALARRLGEGGYQQAIRLFDAKNNACRTAAVYDRILANHSKLEQQ